MHCLSRASTSHNVTGLLRLLSTLIVKAHLSTLLENGFITNAKTACAGLRAVDVVSARVDSSGQSSYCAKLSISLEAINHSVANCLSMRFLIPQGPETTSCPSCPRIPRSPNLQLVLHRKSHPRQTLSKRTRPSSRSCRKYSRSMRPRILRSRLRQK